MTAQDSSHVLCREFRVMDEDQRLDLATLATSMTLPPWHAAAEIAGIAASTSASCIATRIRQLSRIITRVYDDAMRPLGITASQSTLLTQLAQQDGITAVEIGCTLDIEKSTLSRNLKRLLDLGLIISLSRVPCSTASSSWRMRAACRTALFSLSTPAASASRPGRGQGLHATARGWTLLNLFGCLDTPTAGRYWFGGRDVSLLPRDQRAVIRNSQIGFVFQNLNLLPRTTARRRGRRRIISLSAGTASVM
jgi:DNA-binding transcriptional ArsR family regulator